VDRLPRVVDPELVVLQVEDCLERPVLQDALLEVRRRVSLVVPEVLEPIKRWRWRVRAEEQEILQDDFGAL
jgi:hypothetical protein